MEFISAVWVVYAILEHHLPFRGLLSDEMTETIKQVGFRHYMLAWLPTWWAILACSFLAAGMSVGCSIWAVVNQVQEQPVGLPLLIGASSLTTALLSGITPIILAWLKDRSETRQMDHLKHRVQELEVQVTVNQQGHTENAANIVKVTEATQKIAEAAQKILEVKEQSRPVPPE